MGRPRRGFTREFKQEAVKLVAAGGHQTALVARDLGITSNLLRRWKQEVAGDPVAAFPGKGRRSPHKEELTRIKRDLAHVTQERDRLRSVAAYFARPSHEVPSHSNKNEGQAVQSNISERAVSGSIA